MTLPKLNEPLLNKVIDQIKVDKDHWNQSLWRTDNKEEFDANLNDWVMPVTCDTKFCMAGWTVQLGSEHTPVWHNSVCLYAEPGEDKDSYDDGNNKLILAEYRAQRLLGLTADEASLLFYECVTIEDLEDRIEDFKADRTHQEESTK